MTTIQGLKAATVHVRDLSKSRTFYTKNLGLKEAAYDATNLAAYYAIPGTTAMIGVHQWGPMCNEHSGGREPGTVTGVVFNVSNVEKAAAELKQNGVNVTDAPMKTPFGPMAAFADVDGNEFVLMQP